MGFIEEKIKQDMIQTIFTDTLKIYENIDNKFALSVEQKEKVLEKITRLNKDLQELLQEMKLS